MHALRLSTTNLHSFTHYENMIGLTLTLDQVIWHTVMHHSSTSIYTLNFIEIGKTFCE